MNGVIHRHIFLNGRFNRHNVVLIIGLLLCVYFSYHLIQGNRSLVRLVQMQKQIVVSQTEMEDVSARRAAVESKVKMMRPGSVDRDLLEERIQVVLGYANSKDLIVSTH